MTTLNETVEDSLIELEMSLLRTTVRKTAVLARLLSDDFTEFGSSGKVFTKPQVLAKLEGESPVEFDASQFRARSLAAKVVLLTYQVIRRGEPPIRSLRSSIWVKENAQWQQVFHQGTTVEHRP